MKSILLPTDFSKNSENAIKYALALFQDVTCDFYLLNVQRASSFITDDMMVMASSATIYQTIVDVSKRSLENLITKIEIKYSNDKHSFHSVVDYTLLARDRTDEQLQNIQESSVTDPIPSCMSLQIAEVAKI